VFIRMIENGNRIFSLAENVGFQNDNVPLD